MPGLVFLLALLKRCLARSADGFPNLAGQLVCRSLLFPFGTDPGLISLTSLTPCDLRSFPSGIFLLALFSNMIALGPFFPSFAPTGRFLKRWNAFRMAPNQAIACGLGILAHRFGRIQICFGEYLTRPMRFFARRVKAFDNQMSRRPANGR